MNLRLRSLGILLVAATVLCSAIASAQPRLTPKAPPAGAMAPAPPTPALPVAASSIPVDGDIFRDCPNCSEMVVVPAGEFQMGSTDSIYEQPPHRVVIANSFAIGRREITFEEWDRCAAAGACSYRPDDHGWGRGNRPVIDVSWDDAKIFIAWLSKASGKAYRLPTEAEWEYAARAGTESMYWWGRAQVKENANCEDCMDAPPRRTLPTQSFRPNGFGLFDVAGNVAEWVEDCWNDNYRGAPTDGSAWFTGQCRQRSLRGGSFASKANFIRSAARFRYDQDVRYYANGFRVARDLR